MRLFVSVDPPGGVADELVRLVARADIPGSRPTAADHVHLTAMFIGEVAGRDLDDVLESVARSASGIGAFDLTAHRLEVLPERGPPRLIAAMTDLPSPLAELHRRLVHRLARRVRERATFVPHMTLCRLGPGTAGPIALPELVAPITFRVEAVAVKASVLKPGGAEHRVIGLYGLT